MQFYDNWAIHYRMSSHHINAFKCIWRPMFIGLLSEQLEPVRSSLKISVYLVFQQGGLQHWVNTVFTFQSRGSWAKPPPPPHLCPHLPTSHLIAHKKHTASISTSDLPTLHKMYWETKCDRLLWGARWNRPRANNLSKQPAQLHDTVHYKQKYATWTASTHGTDQTCFRSRRLCAHLACEDRMFWQVCVCLTWGLWRRSSCLILSLSFSIWICCSLIWLFPLSTPLCGLEGNWEPCFTGALWEIRCWFIAEDTKSIPLWCFILLLISINYIDYIEKQIS